jgi:small subunit ribosomal protein S1
MENQPPEPAPPSEGSAAPGEERSEASPSPETSARPRKGSRLTGKIVRIEAGEVIVELPGGLEGRLDPAEVRTPEGKVNRSVGEQVRVRVLEGGQRPRVTLKGVRKPGNLPAVLEAWRAGTPVRGKVTGVNKGGLVVYVMGIRAFCPISQIDRHYVEEPERFVGRKLSFRVSSADEKGRNVVLSRRALLEEELREKAEDLRRNLRVGQEVRGVVARIRPFGAFVDLGGLDGLVHVSEISHARVQDPAEVLKVGQELTLKVVRIENLGQENERISLSLKQLQEDPWERFAAGLKTGEKVRGKVVRVVDFGAFLEIAPGVDGLVHVSALAEARVEHPSEIVRPGDEVEAWVISVDRDARRISLSLVDPARLERAARKRPEAGERRRREARSARRDSGERREVPGLTSMAEAFQRLRERLGE